MNDAWDDALLPPPGAAAGARFLWDRFLPEHGFYRWRLYETARAGESGAARARLDRLLGRPEAAAALARLARGRGAGARTRAWAAEAATEAEPARAARDLAAALALEPRPAWRAWRAAALARSGDEAAAIAELGLALEGDPGLAAARALRALLLARAGSVARALADLDEAVSRRPAPGLFTARADLRWRAGRRADAVADAHAALDAHPENLDGFVRLLYARRGSKAAAARGAESELLEDEARRAAADPADAAWGLAALGALLGRGDLQLPPLRAAVAAEPGRAWVRAFLGRALGDERAPGDRAGNLRASLAEMDAAAAAAPRSGWILCWRAEILKRLGRPEEALADLDAGLARDPDYKLGRAWRAELRAARGDARGAAEDFEDCWRTLRRPSFLYRLSQVQRAAGDAAAALDDLAEVVRLSAAHSFEFSTPRWLGGAKRLAHDGPAGARGGAGFALRGRLRRLPAAAPWRALAEPPCLIPAPPPAWRPSGEDLRAAGATAPAEAFRGRDLLDAGREEEALAALERAAKKAPGLHAARLWRGEALGRLGRWRRARADFAAAARTSPRSPLPRLWLGLAAWRLGRTAEAAAAWAEAARLDPPNAHLAAWWLRLQGVPPRARRGARGAARTAAAELELRLGSPARVPGLLRGVRGARAAVLAGAAEAARGRAEAAFERWRAAARAEPEAVAPGLPRLLDGLPPLGTEGSVAAHLALAEAWGRLGRWEDRAGARSVARGLLADGPVPGFAAAAFGAGPGRGSPSGRLAAAAGAAREGRTLAALRAARSAMADDPGAADAGEALSAARPPAWALAARGAAERARGRLDEAAAAFDAALSADASFSPARLWRAELRLARGDAAGALADLDAAGAGTLADADARVWRGRALCALGRCAQAQREFAAAARLAPGSPWAPLAAGVCLERRGDLRRAAPLLRRARRLAPGLFAAAGGGSR